MEWVFFNGLISIPNKYDKCPKQYINKKNDTLINSYIDCCFNLQCRKIYYLRDDSIFNLFSKILISLIKYVICNITRFSLSKKCQTNIWIIKKNNSEILISKQHINHILDIIHYIIAHYIIDCNYLEKNAELNGHASISID